MGKTSWASSTCYFTFMFATIHSVDKNKKLETSDMDPDPQNFMNIECGSEYRSRSIKSPN